MPGPWDASIKLLYPVDQGLFTTIDDIDNNTPFDAIADVEVGENLNEHVDDFVLRVAVLNLTQSTTIAGRGAAARPHPGRRHHLHRRGAGQPQRARPDGG